MPHRQKRQQYYDKRQDLIFVVSHLLIIHCNNSNLISTDIC